MRSPLWDPPTSAMSLCPEETRASAMRTASTPADSSPMNVRDEPVTPCTMEMLPASRLESWARNSVGRRSLISRSLRKAPGSSTFPRLERMVPSTAMSRSPPPAATIMSMRPSSFGIALHARIGQREPRRISSDALPRLHLPLITFLGNLFVEIERCERMDEVRREARGIDHEPSLVQPLPVGVGTFTQARYDSDAGDPGFSPRFSHRRAPPLGIPELSP